MHSAPPRHDEQASLDALARLGVLDTDPEPEFDALVHAATALCGVPVSLITLVDAGRQWFKANVGLPDITETTRDVSFCAHAVRRPELFEIEDTAEDPRFADNPLVVGDPRVRFYAAAPISLSTGEIVGALCVMDRRPRRLLDPQRAGLRHLAVAAAAALESRRARRLLQGTLSQSYRTAMLLRHTADAVIGLSAAGLIELWNPAAALMFGYAEAEMLGQTFAILTPPANHQRQRELLRALADGQARTYDSEGIHRDGNSIALSITSVPEIDALGRLRGATAFLRDTSVRQRAERELAMSEARFRTLSDSSPHGVIFADAQGATTYTNARCQEIYGLDLQETLGHGWTAIVHPQDRANVLDAVLHTVSLRTEAAVEFRILRMDGGVRNVRLLARPVLGADGEFSGFVGSIEDITERLTTALALEKAKERAALAIRSGGIGIWDWDISGGVMLWDAQMYRLYGMAPREDFGDLAQWILHVHPDDRPHVARLRIAAFETGEPFEIEFRVVWADGSVHHIRGSGQVARDEAGHALRLVGSNWDITERKVAEIRLDHERMQLRTLLQTIPDMVSLKDPEGVYLACNVAFENFFGVRTAEIVGKSDHDLMPPDLAASFRQRDMEAMANSGTRIDESPAISPKDGRRLIFEVRKTPMRDQQGTLLGVLGLSRDITVRKQAEEELDRHRHHLQELVDERTAALEQANAAAEAAHRASIERLNAEREAKIQSSKLEAVGTLAAGIAHDFNNILASIVGCAELVDDALPDGSEAKNNVAKVISSSFRARDLVARMLDFARDRPFDPIPMDVVLQVREAIVLLRASLPSSIEMDFRNGMRAASAMILADPTRIMQIVINLCINAAHAMQNRGVIAVSLDRAGDIEGAPREYADGVCLTVADRGCGMTAEVMERIFYPFFTTKPPGEGSGLGLSVVYGIVKDLGGLLNVVSSVLPQERGTRFRVYLPAASTVI
jgi:PAS domain S-box-containing protein